MNVVAPLALVQAALPLLRTSRGTVVSVSSDAAVEAYEGWGGYGSSKAALDQLHRVLAAEEPDLRVYLFDPGDMRTEMHQAAFPGEDISDRPEPESVVPPLRRLLIESEPPERSLPGRGTGGVMTALTAEPTAALHLRVSHLLSRRRSRPRHGGSPATPCACSSPTRATRSLVPSTFTFLPRFLEPGDWW